MASAPCTGAFALSSPRHESAGLASRSEAMKVAVDFSPREEETTLSRVAERRLNAPVPVYSSVVATRRRTVCLDSVRGLKPTATLVVSLRETGRKCPNCSPGFRTPGYSHDVPPGQRKVANRLFRREAEKRKHWPTK